MEQAARGGHLTTRHTLALLCVHDGDLELTAAHAMVAACEGFDISLELLIELYEFPLFVDQMLLS